MINMKLSNKVVTFVNVIILSAGSDRRLSCRFRSILLSGAPQSITIHHVVISFCKQNVILPDPQKTRVIARSDTTRQSAFSQGKRIAVFRRIHTAVRIRIATPVFGLARSDEVFPVSAPFVQILCLRKPMPGSHQKNSTFPFSKQDEILQKM